MKKKTLMIIGGSGFFGNSILEYILNNKKYYKFFKKIIVICRNPKKIKVSKNFKKDYLKIIKKDILKTSKLPYAEYVLYCLTMKNFRKDFHATKLYCKMAEKYHKGSKILFTSSGAIYGQQPGNVKSLNEKYLNKYNIPFSTGYKKNYSKYKLLSEKIFKNLRNSNVDVSIARCFTFVGKFLPRNRHYVIGHIIDDILTKKKIKIKSDYPIFRSYMHADDLSRWLLTILLNTNKLSTEYNVGSDDAVNIQDLVRKLSKKYKLPYENFDPKKNIKKIDKYLPNIKLAKKKFNFNLKYNSFQSVCKTISEIKKSKISNV